MTPTVSHTAPERCTERLRRALPVAIGLALFVVALEVLRLELSTIAWHTLTAFRAVYYLLPYRSHSSD